MFTTAEALAKLWGVDPGDEDKMLGVQVIANGLVNIDLLARAYARQETPAPPRGPDDVEEGSGG